MPATASREVVAEAAAGAAPRGLALDLEGVRVEGRSGGERTIILDVARLALPAGEGVALVGPSGAGKTSLVAVLAGILRPDAGRVRWGHTDVAALRGARADAWRRAHVGLVFQDFHLVPELGALDNVLLPATFDRARVPAALRRRAEALVAAVGLPDPRRRAGLLSRGEQQRTALARALRNAPAILLADEPTASLDAASAAAVIDLLVDAAARAGATLVAATHDPALIARLGARWHLAGGRIATDDATPRAAP